MLKLPRAAKVATRDLQSQLPYLEVPHPGGVAQLVRALPCHGRGRGFESRRSRWSSTPKAVRPRTRLVSRRSRVLSPGRRFRRTGPASRTRRRAAAPTCRRGHTAAGHEGCPTRRRARPRVGPRARNLKRGQQQAGAQPTTALARVDGQQVHIPRARRLSPAQREPGDRIAAPGHAAEIGVEIRGLEVLLVKRLKARRFEIGVAGE